MKIDDFRHMHRGKTIGSLSKEQAQWLKPYEQRLHHNDRALLLLHGFSSSPAVYRELLPGLSSIYGAIVCPALPGHATHLTDFSKVKSYEWVHAVEEAGRDLIANYATVDVMGLSLGGVLACHLAQQFKLNHLYLLAPALSLRINIPLILGLAKFMRTLGFKSLQNKAGNLHTNFSTEIAYRQLPLTTLIEILTLLNKFEFKAPTCPVDLFLGKHDAVVNSSKVAEQFSHQSNVKIHWLQNSAHVLPLDGDVDAIMACVKKNWQARG